jgi:spore photoproduct lyase
MLEIKNQKTKTTACRENGRSADFTSGNFILGCSHKKGDTYDNPCSYCYVARFGRQKLYVNTNTDELLAECDKAIQEPFPRVPNQVDEKYYYVDISCDTDINLHWNDYDWIYVFDYFKKHPKLAATFATKWVNTKLLDYVPENKIRVRMSLMPEKMSYT